MFAGGAAAGRHIASNNVRNMQLFHELKQKFPTVPDQVVSSCIAAHNANPAATSLNDLLLLHQQQQQQQSRQQSREQSREQSLERLPSNPDTTITSSNNNSDQMGGRNTITAPLAEAPSPAPLELQRASDINDNVDNVVPFSPDKEELDGFELVVADSATSDTTTAAASATTHDEMHAATNMPYFPRKIPGQVNAVPQAADPQCDTNGTETESKSSSLRRFVKHPRPNNLPVKSIHQEGATSKRVGSAGLNKIQPSERYNDLHTLLNSNVPSHKKPPKSPVPGKHPPPLVAPKPGRPQTVASQTTDTLLFPPHSPTSNVNLSLNVVVSPPSGEVLYSAQQPPPTPPIKPPRHTTNLNVVPEPTWIQPAPSQAGRSYTSVNLTLRSPTTEPQAPIDITSQNATLTYTTSSFDRARGLQSRLEISVGPGGQSTVSSVRRQRPKSSYHPVLNGLCEDGVGNSVVGSNSDALATATAAGGNMLAAGSLPNLAADEKATTVILEQQVCINRLRIELRTEKTRLVAMQREVADLETIAAAAARLTTRPTAATTAAVARVTATAASPVAALIDHKTEDIEVERRLQREVNHLRGQCEQLADAVDQKAELGVPLGETSREFYQNIYTGQQGSISVTSSATADYTARRIATVSSQSRPGTPGTPPASTPSPHTPRRPPRGLPYPFDRPPQQTNNSQVHPAQLQDETEDQSCWNCSVCTFQNHPLLHKCEQCEMLRGNTPNSRGSSHRAAPPPPYSPHAPTNSRPRSNQHSLTPPRSWLSSNNPNTSPSTPTAVTPGGSSGGSSASTPGSTGKGYPVQQYQVLPPGYIPSPYGGPPTALPWIYPANPMPVNTNPAVFNMQNSPFYVANSDSYGRRSSEGNGGPLRPAPPVPPVAQVSPRVGQHNRSLSQPDARYATGRDGSTHR